MSLQQITTGYHDFSFFHVSSYNFRLYRSREIKEWILWKDPLPMLLINAWTVE
ncbi:MAG: hypothetical protein SPiBPW_04220 [Shewanella algae]